MADVCDSDYSPCDCSPVNSELTASSFAVEGRMASGNGRRLSAPRWVVSQYSPSSSSLPSARRFFCK